MVSELHRVVVTGLGVITSNGVGLEQFENALRNAISGIKYLPILKEHGFSCQVGGVVEGLPILAEKYFAPEDLLAMNETMILASVAATDAWKDAGFEIPHRNSLEIQADTGAIIGVATNGMDTILKALPIINAGKVRRMGSTIVEQMMASAVSAKLVGLFALGNQVSTNSSACSTGTEAILNAYRHIKNGYATKMLAGSVEASGLLNWGGFDAMRVLCAKYNDQPTSASRPMSASAAGFVPGSGAGVLVLETLENALKRNARIYGEIVGVSVNSGGHRNGGSMTRSNPVAAQNCIREAVQSAGIHAGDIDCINGHLTATYADPIEFDNWSKALELKPSKFPYIQATKSLIGHCIAASGSIENVAVLLQLYRGFIHPSINCEDLHEEIIQYENSILTSTIEKNNLEIFAKASFGFGDVNSCIIWRKFHS